jgi:hypothetical protein
MEDRVVPLRRRDSRAENHDRRRQKYRELVIDACGTLESAPDEVLIAVADGYGWWPETKQGKRLFRDGAHRLEHLRKVANEGKPEALAGMSPTEYQRYVMLAAGCEARLRQLLAIAEVAGLPLKGQSEAIKTEIMKARRHLDTELDRAAKHRKTQVAPIAERSRRKPSAGESEAIVSHRRPPEYADEPQMVASRILARGEHIYRPGEAPPLVPEPPPPMSPEQVSDKRDQRLREQALASQARDRERYQAKIDALDGSSPRARREAQDREYARNAALQLAEIEKRRAAEDKLIATYAPPSPTRQRYGQPADSRVGLPGMGGL